MKKVIVFLPFLLFLWGCTNPYSQFYQDNTGGKNVLESPNIIVPTDKPKLIQGSNIKNDQTRMLEDGYFLIGVSSFNAANVNQNLAVEQAKRVHADTVIVYSQYTNTVSGSMPLTVPDTSYQSGTIYGSGGEFASYSGTTYGSRTTYIPYNVRRYDYHATFWIKAKPPSLGIFFDNLTDELRRKIESNKGVYILVVAKDSPAFNADLLSGDVIRKLNDTEVIDRTHFGKLLAENKGQQITLEIFRNDKTIIKQIQLN